MANKTSCVKFGDFEVILNFKKRVKNTRLKITKTGEISISMPFYATKKYAVSFLEFHKEWLIKTHKKVIENLPKDDEIVLFGKIYKIKFDDNLKDVVLSEDEIYAPNLKVLERYKKDEARKVFDKFIAKFQPKIGKKINRVVIRKMTTRWGSCNSRKGYINLNLNLIQKEPGLIEYVVLHELAHLLYPHHGREFYEYIANFMPDYKSRERALNKNQ